MLRAPLIRRAVSTDSASIVALVERAYRGSESFEGWTTEAHLLDGQRTDADEIEALLADPDVQLLSAWLDLELVGSVVVKRGQGTASLSMLAVLPRRQGSGIGSALLDQAEAVARGWAARALSMYVIDLRRELIAYYTRRGYIATGRTEPFPYGNPRFGLPKVEDLRFLVLEKQLV